VQPEYEFLIVEQIAECRDGAHARSTTGARRFMDEQLRAAIRRNPRVATDVLREHLPDLF
jgi:hypothetical protein